MNKFKRITLLLALVLSLSLTGCSQPSLDKLPGTGGVIVEDSMSEVDSSLEEGSQSESTEAGAVPSALEEVIDVSLFCKDQPYAEVNGNEPFFTDEEKVSTEPFETFAELDALGRCGVTYANVCRELMPPEERGEIGQVKPTGWHTVKYDCVDGKYLYNRAHLLGFQLTGENANKQNLITGTRFFNVDGMLPFENMVADYVKETDNHVLYRVTPIFEGENLVANGVLMEAYSVEDKGEGICFCVFVYNCQPGVAIDYATGESWEDSSVGLPSVSGMIITNGNSELDSADQSAESSEAAVQEYILNTNSMKFHLPECESAAKTSEKNKQEYTGTRESLIQQGYEACGVCHP